MRVRATLRGYDLVYVRCGSSGVGQSGGKWSVPLPISHQLFLRTVPYVRSGLGLVRTLAAPLGTWPYQTKDGIGLINDNIRNSRHPLPLSIPGNDH